MTGPSVVIITHNEEQNILRTLGSVKSFAGEIVVVDSHSTDRTAEICRESGCRVFLREFSGYGPQKQYAAEQAASDWIFWIDADEVATPELQKEITALFAGPASPGAEAFRIPRSLSYMGRIMRHSGAGKEYLVRLFDRRHGQFNSAAVHESVEVRGTTGTLNGELLHYSYRSLSHHLEKINHYTTLAAEDQVRKGKRYPRAWVALKFPVSFFTFYVLKGGILDGYPGLVWSFLAAFYGAMKIAKTIEKTGRT
ncbi:MAG TPA: glycosyltransferase family 2 protein [Bacteroidales bacterium]|nr:glycosyltransferase family 2 protein [Bacteroidales bacterium]HPS61417.1 glycosyltransferase family 2 protein [Bacteroidales bacterium]